MKLILLVLAFAMISSNNFAPELLKFLELQEPDTTVRIEKCQGTYPYNITRTRVDPAKLKKGDTMKLSLAGSNAASFVESKIQFQSYLDGKLLQTDFEDRKNHVVNPGSANVIQISRDTPTVIPSGKWKIIITQFDDKNNANWCINVTFEF